MSISSKIEVGNSNRGVENTTPVELPSLKKTILKPRNLLIILVISLLLNIVLMIAALSSTDNPKSTNVATTPTRQANSTPKATNKPTLNPTQSPEEAENSILQCFRNCDVDGLIENTRSVALNINNFKHNSVFTTFNERNCYGIYLENDSPDKEMNSYYPEICENSYASKPPATTIHIADNLYVLNSSGNWSLESKPRFGQSKLIRIIDETKAQQEKTLKESQLGKDFKQIVSTSKTINDLSQQVTKTATITINSRLEVVDYSIEIEKVSKEQGYFFGIGETNNIQAPF